ncbi:MAG TPA: hypothetical protein VHY10_08765 [Xanthobacteraceae bacterium]|nr:hypothetical protein [Xanthobacteraceae bacterium]
MIRLRFVTANDVVSDAIRFAEDFPYSHVEAVTPWGTYLGAHADGGVLDRPNDYDKGSFAAEKFVLLNDTPPGAEASFYAFLKAKIGTPYDYEAILGFVSRLDLHKTGDVICSALQAQALRGCRYFPFPIAVHSHEVSPRDLALMLSARISF